MSYGLENYQYQNVWQDVMLGSSPVENGIPESGNLQDEAYTGLRLASEEPDLKILLAEGDDVYKSQGQRRCFPRRKRKRTVLSLFTQIQARWKMIMNL